MPTSMLDPVRGQPPAPPHRVVAWGQAPASAGQVRLSWPVTSSNVQVFTYCPGLPGRGTSLDAELVIGGTPAASINCNADLHQDPSGGEDGMLPGAALSVGDTATATYRIVGAQDRLGRPVALPTTGTVYVALAEKVAFTDYPLPKRPAKLSPPKTDGLATEPGTRIVHSDPADPNKPVTTTLTWHAGYELFLSPQTPGIYQISVNGVPLLTKEVYDYRNSGVGRSCGPVLPGQGTCVAGLRSVKDGETVTVTVTVRYATGPWLAEVRSQRATAAGNG